MQTYDLFINGQHVRGRSGETMPAINPATAEPWAEVAVGGIDEINDAIAAALAAHRSGVWRNRSRAERADIVVEIANQISARQEELALIEVQDAGCTLRKATTADLPAATLSFSQVAEDLRAQPEEERFEETNPVSSVNIIRREPIGVCAGIVPWNFPLLMAAWKIAPAIATGNTVVLKPSPNTAVSALLLAEICRDAGVPDGVVNVVAGLGPELGEALVTHPDVGKVAFTGSTRVGKRIMALASGTLKRLTLELGGKSPNIILEDADLDCAVRGALFGTFFHQGQACESGTRVLVPRRLHDNLVDRMIAAAKEIRVGDPMDPMSTMGPLISETQLETVQRYVRRGIEEGARCVLGGRRPKDLGPGYFFEPTIFTGVTNDMTIAREEIFGPVIAVIPFDDEDEAVRIANDSLYGLGGAIWSRDLDRATAMARRIETGTIWINDYHLVNLRFPFGGYKESGFGRELGAWGLDEFQQLKHIHVGEPTPASEKFYFNWTFNPPEEG